MNSKLKSKNQKRRKKSPWTKKELNKLVNLRKWHNLFVPILINLLLWMIFLVKISFKLGS